MSEETEAEWMERTQREIEALLDDPDDLCPGCGVQSLMMHKEGCPESPLTKKEEG